MIGVSGAPGTLLLTGSVESEGSGVHKDEMLTQSATYEIEAYRGMREHFDERAVDFVFFGSSECPPRHGSFRSLDSTLRLKWSKFPSFPD